MTKSPQWASAVLLLADGTVFWGKGAGAKTTNTGEVCFNTSMTGYQETLTDPSYAGQIITFTFPHVGIVGVNDEDHESGISAVRGCILAAEITEPSNWRSGKHFDTWLKERGIPAICGVDTRKITTLIREAGAITGTLAHFGNGDGAINLSELHDRNLAWPGLEGMDLAGKVSTKQSYHWRASRWRVAENKGAEISRKSPPKPLKVVTPDFGIKHNSLRFLKSLGCEVVTVPAKTSFAAIMAQGPDGVFLSNGPGDPEATGEYAAPVIREILKAKIPLFGICLGHQLLALALGAKTKKMHHGHRGANHPVKDLLTGRVEITSQNHGFVVDDASLPPKVEKSHVSLFDGTLEGLSVQDRPVFSVQFHPEASPGPEDSSHLFSRFVSLMEERRRSAFPPL